jgi:hypothetical protein
MYRKFLMGTLMAMGIGLTGSTATPVSGSALLNATADTSPVEQVRYYRHRGYYGRGYYGRGYYGRGYYGPGYYGPGYYGPGYYGPGYYRGCILGVLC